MLASSGASRAAASRCWAASSAAPWASSTFPKRYRASAKSGFAFKTSRRSASASCGRPCRSRTVAGEDRLRLRGAVAAHEGESVGVLQRRVVFPPWVVAQQRRRLVERFRVEPRDRQHALEGDVARLVGKGAGERPRGLVELLRVEEGYAQRVLHLRKGGVDLRRRLEKLRRAREALPLRLDHAEVQAGSRERG